MTEPFDEDLPGVDEANRDPGASLDAEGVPEVADEATPGTGEVPDPERPVAPADEPTEDLRRGVGDHRLDPTGITAELRTEAPDLPDGLLDDRPGREGVDGIRVESDEDVLGLDDEPLDGDPLGDDLLDEEILRVDRPDGDRPDENWPAEDWPDED